MTCELVDDLETALAFAAQWDELADALDAGPLARPAYALSWWRHLGRGRLLVAVVRRDGRLVALAPLHERRVGPLRVARWLGHGLGTVTEALVRPGEEEAARLMWSTLATRGRVLELVETRAGSAGLNELIETTGRGRVVSVVHRDVCPYADLEADGLAHLHRPGARNLRKTLSKADRDLRRAGLEFRLEVAQDPGALEAALPAIRSVFDAAEDDHPRQHLLRPPYEDFVLDQLRTGVASRTAVAMVGHLGDRPVSFQLALQAGRTLYLWITRYDPDVARHRPGHLLLREVHRWAAAQGLARVDQLLGESQTKRQWSTGSYDTLEITQGTPAALAGVRAAVGAAGAVHRARAWASRVA